MLSSLYNLLCHQGLCESQATLEKACVESTFIVLLPSSVIMAHQEILCLYVYFHYFCHLVFWRGIFLIRWNPFCCRFSASRSDSLRSLQGAFCGFELTRHSRDRFMHSLAQHTEILFQCLSAVLCCCFFYCTSSKLQMFRSDISVDCFVMKAVVMWHHKKPVDPFACLSGMILLYSCSQCAPCGPGGIISGAMDVHIYPA